VKVPPSIAEGLLRTPVSIRAARRLPAWPVGLVIVLGALALYWLSNPDHFNVYNHFVWQADAFLHGRAWIPYPVPPTADLPENWYLQDLFPIDAEGTGYGRALLPFPPLPAIVLLPFVAAYGFATDQEAIAVALGGLGVGLAWWMLGGLRLRLAVRAIAVGIFATGTVWWWAASVGSTWYLAHLVAVNVALVAVGVALRHDGAAPVSPAWDDEEEPGPPVLPHRRIDRVVAAVWPLDRSQVLVGLLLGIAVTARLPMIFAAPLFMAVGGGGTVARRTASAAVGGVLPVAALLGYTFLTTGSFLHPGYDYQYQLEVEGYPTLGYRADWAVEDLRYIAQNLEIMLLSFPVVAPDVLPNTLGIYPDVPVCTEPGAGRSLFDPECPIAVPVDIGTSLLLSAPGLLLAVLAYVRRGRSRLALGTAAAVLLIAAFNLAHFSQGWVQWGYRFSLDWLPFVLPMVALGAARHVDGRPRLIAYALLVVGALVNLWGVTWGQFLAW
jgi:hypothetical protein